MRSTALAAYLIPSSMFFRLAFCELLHESKIQMLPLDQKIAPLCLESLVEKPEKVIGLDQAFADASHVMKGAIGDLAFASSAASNPLSEEFFSNVDGDESIDIIFLDIVIAEEYDLQCLFLHVQRTGVESSGRVRGSGLADWFPCLSYSIAVRVRANSLKFPAWRAFGGPVEG